MCVKIRKWTNNVLCLLKANTPNSSVFMLHWRLWTAQIIVLWPIRLTSSDLHLTSCHSHTTSCQILAPDAFWHQYQVPPLLHLAAPGKKTSELSHGGHRSALTMAWWLFLQAWEFKECLIYIEVLLRPCRITFARQWIKSDLLWEFSTNTSQKAEQLNAQFSEVYYRPGINSDNKPTPHGGKN